MAWYINERVLGRRRFSFEAFFGKAVNLTVDDIQTKSRALGLHALCKASPCAFDAI